LTNIQNIIFIGAGNVATHLSVALKKAGFTIGQVYSRSVDSAQKLANLLNVDFTTDLISVKSTADLYVISLSDDATAGIMEKLNIRNKFLVHTSGSLHMDILADSSENYGVFYPLQTFSKQRTTDFATVPLCLEANNDVNLEALKAIAHKISGDVRVVNSEQRKAIHLAAVFVCNFPNFMYSVAEQITGNAALDFDILKPLISETAAKVQQINPWQAQTGPAFRDDKKTMEEHLRMLEQFPDYAIIYELLSKAIQTNKQKLEKDHE